MLDRTYNVVELLERKVCLVDFAAWLKATTRITDAYFITFFWWVITKKASSSFPGSAASLSSSCPASPWSSSTSSSSPPWGEQSRGDAGWRSTRRSRWRKPGWQGRTRWPGGVKTSLVFSLFYDWHKNCQVKWKEALTFLKAQLLWLKIRQTQSLSGFWNPVPRSILIDWLVGWLKSDRCNVLLNY